MTSGSRRPLRRVSLLAALLGPVLLAACASQQEAPPQPVAPPPEPVKPVAPAPAPVKPQAPAFSDVQRSQLDAELDVKSGNKLLRKLIADAAPTLRDFLATEACLIDDNGSALNAFAAAADTFPASGYKAPMLELPQHDKTRCLDVADLHGWKAYTITHMRVETTYRDSSGQTLQVLHELKRDADGKWLMTR